jgi:hypothetical protein
MDRRVWKIKTSSHFLLIFLLPMKLLSQPPTIGLTLPSIFAEHVEASKQAFGKKVEFASLTPRSPMRVRGTLQRKWIIWAPCWWSLRGRGTRIRRSINGIDTRIAASSINTGGVLAKTERLS